MSEATPNPERVALSSEFNALLIELSVALHKQAMYPSGHPSLEPAAAAVARSAARLLEERDQISFGVARRQLIIEGVATDPDHPVLRRLAEGLNRHHLGAISILRGVECGEIGSALRALAADAERDGPLGLIPPERLPAWPHIRLHPLTYDRLTLVADAPVAGGPDKEAESRAVELWIGLARAALAADDSRPLESGDMEPAVIARAIDQRESVQGYDQVVVGHLLQIARELKIGTDAESAALRRRTGRMVSALQPGTLRRLVEMGGDVTQRHAFVRDAANGMAVGAVLEIVRAAADAGGQTISHGLVRMLSKLASQAEVGGVEARPLADGALREQVVQLLTGWELADPNPEDYGRLLQQVAAASPDRPRPPTNDPVVLAEPIRMAQMSLELDASGPLLSRALDRAIQEGGITGLLQVLAAAPGSCRSAPAAIRAKLLEPVSIRALMGQTPIDFTVLDELLPSLPLESYSPLLDALAESDDRLTRRKLMDRLARPAVDISPLVAERLQDERWFVCRNMLALLEQSGQIPAGFSASTWTSHPDPRVRHQAIRLQLTLPAERDQALRTALEDPDPRLVRVGLTALRQECPVALTSLVIRIAETASAEEDVRLLAVRALGHSREPQALDALLRMVPVTRSWFWRQRLAPPTPVSLAALESLAAGWSGHPRVAPIMALASRSSDPAVRQAAGRGKS